MRVTFLLRSLDRTGGNRMVAMHAAGLRARGHTVEVVASWLEPPAPRLSRLLNRVRPRPPRRPPAPASHLESHGITPRLTEWPGRLRPDEVPEGDVVVATWWETAEWALALPPSKGARAHYVQHYEVFDYTPRVRVEATYRSPGLHRIAVAPWLVRKLRDDFGDAEVDLVPNTIDAERFDAPARGRQPRPTVGFIHGATPFKAPEVALEALRRIRAAMPEVRVIGFGTSDLHATVPGTEWIEYTTNPSDAAIREHYAQADVWISTSSSEGFNLPVMEAMACRTPAVATRTGWPADALVDGVNGWVCEIGDVAAVADRALRVLRLAPSAWATLSAEAHRTAHALTWPQASALFEQALERAIRRQGAGADLGTHR